jgi:hypothetical protein
VSVRTVETRQGAEWWSGLDVDSFVPPETTAHFSLWLNVSSDEAQTVAANVSAALSEELNGTEVTVSDHQTHDHDHDHDAVGFTAGLSPARAAALASPIAAAVAASKGALGSSGRHLSEASDVLVGSDSGQRADFVVQDTAGARARALLLLLSNESTALSQVQNVAGHFGFAVVGFSAPVYAAPDGRGDDDDDDGDSTPAVVWVFVAVGSLLVVGLAALVVLSETGIVDTGLALPSFAASSPKSNKRPSARRATSKVTVSKSDSAEGLSRSLLDASKPPRTFNLLPKAPTNARSLEAARELATALKIKIPQ